MKTGELEGSPAWMYQNKFGINRLILSRSSVW